jgi:hypothetical protein
MVTKETVLAVLKILPSVFLKVQGNTENPG